MEQFPRREILWTPAGRRSEDIVTGSEDPISQQASSTPVKLEKKVMARNRFEQVDAPQPDAITLSLMARDGQTFGTITCPAAVSNGRLQQDVASGEMGDLEAFRSAIRLANEIKAPIVVIDPHGIWKPEWGDLYQVTGED
jgi:hypothetical protein